MKAATRRAKPESITDGNMESKKKKHELSSTIKSLKVKMQQKDSDKKKAANAESSSTLAQRIKKTAKDLSRK